MITIPLASTFVTIRLADGFCLRELEGCSVVPRTGDVVRLETATFGTARFRVVDVEWSYAWSAELGHHHDADVTVELDGRAVESAGSRAGAPSAEYQGALREQLAAVIGDLRRMSAQVSDPDCLERLQVARNTLERVLMTEQERAAELAQRFATMREANPAMFRALSEAVLAYHVYEELWEEDADGNRVPIAWSARAELDAESSS